MTTATATVSCISRSLRYQPKGFKQRRPDGKGGWIWNLPLDARHRFLPYRLPELQEAIALGKPVFVVEGEKDVENGRSKLGVVATCNAAGAGKWSPEHAAYMKDADVVIIPDNDEAGRNHSEDVAASLVGIAGRTRIVTLPHLPPKGDLSDWIDAGGTAEQLWALVEKAPEWSPPAQPNRRERRAVSSAIRRLVSKRGDEVTMRRMQWVWMWRIAKGKHTAFAGEPGIGKSQLLLWVAATASRGGDWPCGEGKAPLGSVVLLSAEDGVEDTILPRYLAAGGDPKKLHIITAVKDEQDGHHTFNLQADLKALEEKINEVGDVVLVIIDPISSYMGGTDSHRNSEVRGAIEPLSEMADRLGVAIVSNTHFSKAGASTKSRALHRFVGSIAFVGAPRAAFAVVEEPRQKKQDGEQGEEPDDTPARRLLLHVKTNLGPAPQGLAYTLESGLAGYIGDPPERLEASRIKWDDAPVTKTADQAIAEHEASLRGDGASSDEAPTETAEVVEFLRQVLRDGPMEVREIERLARDAGLLGSSRKPTSRSPSGGEEEPWHQVRTGRFWPRREVCLAAPGGATLRRMANPGIGSIGALCVHRRPVNWTGRLLATYGANGRNRGVVSAAARTHDLARWQPIAARIRD